jgi:glycosyltransferase involved in cell wall biosynthesis
VPLPARLVLIGDGPDREHAMAVASDLGCIDKVEHLGMQDQIQDLLPQADLFLSASETESFGLSMLEAMSCGVPCISTAVGGVGEVIGDFPIFLPTVAVTSIGAGGGSIAAVDELGVLRVGPESAGSTPGPACYGRGGERPTITDAMAVLGFSSDGS